MENLTISELYEAYRAGVPTRFPKIRLCGRYYARTTGWMTGETPAVEYSLRLADLVSAEEKSEADEWQSLYSFGVEKLRSVIKSRVESAHPRTMLKLAGLLCINLPG